MNKLLEELERLNDNLEGVSRNQIPPFNEQTYVNGGRAKFRRM